MKKGFTLLELLIVIIIIGLLAAIGIVQYGRAVVNAKNAEAKGTLEEMRKAEMAYYALTGDYTATIANLASIDLDSDTIADVKFSPPTGGSYTYTTTIDYGQAAKTSASGGESSWRIDWKTGKVYPY